MNGTSSSLSIYHFIKDLQNNTVEACTFIRQWSINNTKVNDSLLGKKLFYFSSPCYRSCLYWLDKLAPLWVGNTIGSKLLDEVGKGENND